MFKKILFATTGTESCDNAAKAAFELARTYNAHLIVFHVVGLPSHGYSQEVRDIRSGEMEQVDENYLDCVRDELKTRYERQLEIHEDCEFMTANGTPSREILRAARKQDVDMIVLGTHTSDQERGVPAYRRVVGNTLQKVAKSAKCPVQIVNRPCEVCWNFFTNIVLGVDFSKWCDYAFQFAYRTARDLNSNLHIFHCLNIKNLYQDSENLLPQDQIEKKIRETEKRIDYQYVSRLKDFRDYEVRVREGVPFLELLKYSREKEANLIILAHHTKEDVPAEEADLGNTVEQIVLRSASPVISINHPDKIPMEQ